jgi:hypothetical protein
MGNQQSTLRNRAAFGPGPFSWHPAVGRMFPPALPVTQSASEGVVPLAGVSASPALAAGGATVRQRTDPDANLCLPGDGITEGGRAAKANRGRESDDCYDASHTG